MTQAASRGVPAQPSAFPTNGVTAHRGNAEDHPENTMPAFDSAIALGADWIETDIRQTRDGEIVVLHDGDAQRVGGAALVVAESTWDELSAVDAAHAFRAARGLSLEQCPRAAIPRLGEVLALVASQTRTRLSIQPKSPCVDQAIALVRRAKAEPWVGFNDGDLDKMRRVKEIASLRVFWDRPADSNIDEDIATARRFGFEGIVVHHAGMTPEKAGAIARAGIEPGAWTVNDAPAMGRLLRMGVQRIYTDNPRELLALQHEGNFA